MMKTARKLQFHFGMVFVNRGFSFSLKTDPSLIHNISNWQQILYVLVSVYKTMNT